MTHNYQHGAPTEPLLNFTHDNGSALTDASTALTGPGCLRWAQIAWANFTGSDRVGLTDTRTGKRIFDVPLYGSGCCWFPVNVQIQSTATWSITGSPGASEACRIVLYFEDTSPDNQQPPGNAFNHYK